jgi:hypothetical protein
MDNKEKVSLDTQFQEGTVYRVDREVCVSRKMCCSSFASELRETAFVLAAFAKRGIYG